MAEPLPESGLAELSAVSPPQPPPAPKQAVSSSVSGCGDNFYANYIYMHESGCRTDAFGSLTSLGRACGIGQALPCSKMGCSLSDYGCQNAFFTQYANDRYGGWHNAYIYWVNHQVW
jgi:hypothetical protein